MVGWLDGWVAVAFFAYVTHLLKKSGVHMEMLGKSLDEMMMIHGMDGWCVGGNAMGWLYFWERRL